MIRHSSRIVTRLGLTAGAALLAGATLPAAAHAVTPAAGRKMATPPAASGPVLLHQRVNADGSRTATWRQGNRTLTISGDFGTLVSAKDLAGTAKDGAATASGSVDVAVSSRVHDKRHPQAAVAAYAHAGRSVVKDAIATGVAPDVAQRVFGRMVGTSATSSVVPLAARPTRPASVLDSWCVNLSGDAGNATAHGCVTRNLDYSSGGDWYISNHEILSGRDNDWWYSMDTLKIWLVYGSGNSVVSWAPNGTFPVHSCSSITMGVTDPKTGAGISTTTNVCPDSMGPVWTDSYRGFGSMWRGYSNNYQGADATTVVHNPPSTSDYATLHIYMHWS